MKKSDLRRIIIESIEEIKKEKQAKQMLLENSNVIKKSELKRLIVESVKEVKEEKKANKILREAFEHDVDKFYEHQMLCESLVEKGLLTEEEVNEGFFDTLKHFGKNTVKSVVDAWKRAKAQGDEDEVERLERQIQKIKDGMKKRAAGEDNDEKSSGGEESDSKKQGKSNAGGGSKKSGKSGKSGSKDSGTTTSSTPSASVSVSSGGGSSNAASGDASKEKGKKTRKKPTRQAAKDKALAAAGEAILNKTDPKTAEQIKQAGPEAVVKAAKNPKIKKKAAEIAQEVSKEKGEGLLSKLGSWLKKNPVKGALAVAAIVAVAGAVTVATGGGALAGGVAAAASSPNVSKMIYAGASGGLIGGTFGGINALRQGKGWKEAGKQFIKQGAKGAALASGASLLGSFAQQAVAASGMLNSPQPPAGETQTTDNPPRNPDSRANAETDATGIPKAETPAAETPKAETPAAETPKAETPAAETPAAETPKAAETPAAETPKAETPAEIPVTPEVRTAAANAVNASNNFLNTPEGKEYLNSPQGKELTRVFSKLDGITDTMTADIGKSAESLVGSLEAVGTPGAEKAADALQAVRDSAEKVGAAGENLANDSRTFVQNGDNPNTFKPNEKSAAELAADVERATQDMQNRITGQVRQDANLPSDPPTGNVEDTTTAQVDLKNIDQELATYGEGRLKSKIGEFADNAREAFRNGKTEDGKGWTDLAKEAIKMRDKFVETISKIPENATAEERQQWRKLAYDQAMTFDRSPDHKLFNMLFGKK
jgi:hypothetical protein